MEKYPIIPAADVPRVVEFLEDRLYEHNSKMTGRDDGRLFSLVVRSEGDDIIAGVAGWTWAGACEITQLWVDESVRAQGIGLGLLEAAEKEAKGRGCAKMLVRSYGFQAPAFYERHGYRPVCVIEGFPAAGHSYYILMKVFA